MVFGASENTIGYASDYMRIHTLAIFVQLALGLNAFINTQGYAKTGMITIAIGEVAILFWIHFYIRIWYGGVKGAALHHHFPGGFRSLGSPFLCSPKSYLRIRKKNFRLELKLVFRAWLWAYPHL